MTNMFKDKSYIEIIALILIVVAMIFSLTGCNKQIFDFDYEYDEIICNYDGDKFELKIDKWTDYEGEQLQVKSNGKTYLLSANKCYMIEK